MEQRKTVTVLFCDVTGSTALGETVDPERLRALLARYFERMKEIVERHGGTVEKFIGDAVMAVFGVPVAHEDDALRAARAAVEMRDALPELGVAGRIGIMTGEVVTGTSERLVTGDAVNVAARLEQASAPGEVLIGDPTFQLVRGAAEAEPVEPLSVKGKAEPVAAWRLLRVADAPERLHETEFVGRDRELAVLHEAWRRVRDERRCELVTVVGEAGVGKSRLVAEALEPLDAAVARGRCLPYGEGITYWPVVEVLKQLDARPDDESAAAAIRSVLGESDARTSADEIAWAFRKTLEAAAASAPLLVIFDDIQWGEETFRDLIEHVALFSTGAPLLLVCMARPELTEQHKDWPVTLRLEPLHEEDVAKLIPERLARELRRQIVDASGGNPLFVTEMLAMADDSGGGTVTVPPTIQALLAARLDQLEPSERAVLEWGSVEGEVFHRGTVQALSSDEAPVTPRLAALVRKQLIRAEHSLLTGDDGFRFRHLLIRDAAYDALAKSARSEMHRRLAAWLEQNPARLVEHDEIAGYHLEQAHAYRVELGLPEDRELAEAARRHLGAAGERAARRQDYIAAARLLERAAALVPEAEIDLRFEAELGEVLVWLGRTEDAVARAEASAERASATGDRAGSLGMELVAGFSRLVVVDTSHIDDFAALVEEAVPVLEAAGDPMGLYVGYTALGELMTVRGREDAALEAYERAFGEAARAGYEPSIMVGRLAYLRFMGSTPVRELLAWFDELDDATHTNQFVRAYRGWSLAKIGRFEEARAIISEARAQQAERGGGLLLANLTAFESVSVELLAGDVEAAVGFGEEGCRLHEELGPDSFLAFAAAGLAQALYACDRLEEAEAWVDRTVEIGTRGDQWTESVSRQVRAKLLARRGRHAEAERLAREATAHNDATDRLDPQGDSYADLGEVLRLAGDSDGAAAAFEQALDRYERKGNIVMAGRVRAQLDGLRVTAAP